MSSLLHFLTGSRTLRMDASAAGEVMNLCQRYGLVYWNFRFCGEQICLDTSIRTAKKLLPICRARNISIVAERGRGLPALAVRYRHRLGIFVGALLFGAILFWSGRVLWGIEINGNRALSDEAVIEELRACGLTLGCPLSELDTEVLENRVLIASDEISWISVNLIGTVAHVELREVEERPLEESTMNAANLVASKSGRIEMLEEVRGQVMVKPGDLVSAGELLVSGLSERADGSIRYRVAEGRVYARTEVDFLVEIPLTETQNCCVEKKTTQKSLIFFENEIKFFTNSRNLPDTCDTIEVVDTVSYFSLWDGRKLPFGIRTVEACRYEPCEVTRTTDEAMAMAYERLSERIVREVPEGMLVRKQTSAEPREDAFALRCRAEFIENVALTKEIEIEF